MKLSRKFLEKYLDLDNVTTNELAHEMMLIGHEYESIKKLASGTNLVVGEVLEVSKHENSDSLYVCQVRLDDKTVNQIVCGASNVKKDQKVIVAKEGSVLPGDFKIKKTVIRDVESNGMICSLSEIGIDTKYQTEEDKVGIHVLSNDAKVGDDPLKHLSFDDEVIDFELTANRGDLLSVKGMAYEVGALFNLKLKEQQIKYNEIDESINDKLSVKVETKKAPVYLAKMVTDVKIKESPSHIKSLLIASGIRPINNVVDISNLVMLEYGQPLHFFDYDKLNKEILVREAKDNELVTTLDLEERVLDTEDIVITSNNEVVALAGVMGAHNSEITNDTTSIVIEAAIFDSIQVRKTSNKYLKSESSIRFEKGIDKTRTYEALEKAVQLLEKYADAKVLKDTIIHDVLYQDEVKIKISLEFINKILGYSITSDEVINLLKRLSFDVEGTTDFVVTVPSHRLDVTIKEDLVEEIARLNGTEKLIGTLPRLSVKPGSYDSKYLYEQNISEKLLTLGLFETRTYTLTNSKLNKLFNINNIEFLINNKMSEEREYLRQSIIPSLINVANYNLKRNRTNIEFFEISNIYEDINTERTKLGILVSNELVLNSWNNTKVKRDFYYIKGIIEVLFEYLGLTNRYTFIENNKYNDLHPHKSAIITLDRKEVGFIGRVHPKIDASELFVAELDLEVIFNTKVRKLKAKEVSKYPEVNKDFAFIVSLDTPADLILNDIKRSSRDITDVVLFDIYEGSNIEDGYKSLAFNVQLQSLSKTLTEEEIDKTYTKIIENITSKHDAIFRDK